MSPKPQRPPSTSHLFGFAWPRRLIWRRKIHGLQFHPPHTTAAASSRRGTCLLLHTAGGSFTQNPGKIGRLIQAVLVVTSAPARFWDRGARWFVERFEGLRQLKQSCSVCSAVRWLFGIRPVSMPRHDKVSPSRTARGYRNSWEEQRSRRQGDSRRSEVRGERLSRSVMERWAFWSQHLDDNSERRTPAVWRSSNFNDKTLFQWYAEKVYLCVLL